ncbi:hypothetical protein INF28_03980 [Oscillospiraceae bacterium DSM 107454]|uniref:Sporulation protein YtxC n=2 Tax=Ructibacterium gallinarum TaxID=2779355 RepID=A0A9D5LZY7_9FIRM|nr:hypothetical protein [Ructibacterium gallinarum]
MQCVTICTKNDLSELKQVIENQFSAKYHRFFQNENGLKAFTLNKKDLPEISIPMAKWINQSIFKNKIQKIIANKYQLLTEEERLQICLISIQRLKEENTGFNDMIRKQLLLQFELNNQLNLEGFVTFCLKEYQTELELLIEECLEEYLTEKDYYEFLELLRYFAEVEESRFGSLIIRAQKDGSYHYFDENLYDITSECKEIFFKDFADPEASEDDILVSILIILLPEQIYFLNAEYIQNTNILQTLKAVFQDRLLIDSGNHHFITGREL